MRLSPMGRAGVLAEFECIKKLFKKDYCEWLAKVRRDFYHA
jgi:hypothetical protein